MLAILSGFVCFALAIYQMYATRNLFIHVKQHGNESTSPFLLMGLWSNVVFSVALMILGLYLLFAFNSMFYF